MKEQPYHERYYLLYGHKAPPSTLDIGGTLSFLKGAGYGDNFLRQAREKQDLALEKEKELGEARGQHCCSFCGEVMFGAEYEILKDGRERCTACSRTAIKKKEDFQVLFTDVKGKFEKLFGVTLKGEILVKMVDDREFSRKKGIKDLLSENLQKSGNRYYVIVRNGSPRIYTIQCVVKALTGVWQDQNWKQAEIAKKYGAGKYRQVKEGMAEWAGIQYHFLTGESAYGKRMEMQTADKTDDAGVGFRMYRDRYSISYGAELEGPSPFDDPEFPLGK